MRRGKCCASSSSIRFCRKATEQKTKTLAPERQGLQASMRLSGSRINGIDVLGFFLRHPRCTCLVVGESRRVLKVILRFV
jgi:hypothetical protein